MQIVHNVKRFFKSFGPGFVTGIADDDPSGIATYAQTGALFGLQQVWLSLYSLPFMFAVQETCARIGLVTGKGLAGVMKKYYAKPVLIFAVTLLGIANIINIGADLGAMGGATSMITPLTSGQALILITVFTIFCAILIPYPLYVRILKYFAATVFAYVITAFFISHDWSDVFRALVVPHITWNKEHLLNIMAFLGTTISPYLFFWEADEEVEDEREKKKIIAFGKGTPKVSHLDIKKMRKDTFVGMFLSNMVAFFIIITAQSTLQNGQMISSATELAESLRPLAGDYAVYLFSFAILGTGLLAIPVLAGSFAYALSETFDMKVGLGESWRKAPGFYAIIAIATLVGVLLNFLHIDPIKMLYYSAAVNGLLAAPLLAIIFLIANNKKVMGDKKNSIISNIFVGFITIVMALISIFTIEAFLR